MLANDPAPHSVAFTAPITVLALHSGVASAHSGEAAPVTPPRANAIVDARNNSVCLEVPIGNLAYSTFTTADIANLQKSVGDLTSEFSNINTKIDGLGQRARQADGGIAAAMALGGTMLLPDTSVSVSFNLATYRGEQGFSGSVVARVRENVWISGGIGGSTVKRSTGGRVGVSFGW